MHCIDIKRGNWIKANTKHYEYESLSTLEIAEQSRNGHHPNGDAACDTEVISW